MTRYCDLKLYSPNSIILNEEERTITFLLWNLSGQLTGYQQYRPDNHEKATKNNPDKRYYCFTGEEGDPNHKKGKKRISIFGLETIKRFNNAPIFLTEGIFDAARLHYNGLCALALLSNDPKYIKSFLYTFHRPLIAVCDGDVGGKKLAKYGHQAIYLADDKDIGSLTDDEFNEIFKYFRK